MVANCHFEPATTRLMIVNASGYEFHGHRRGCTNGRAHSRRVPDARYAHRAPSWRRVERDSYVPCSSCRILWAVRRLGPKQFENRLRLLRVWLTVRREANLAHIN